jgi:hypothetical protein
MLKFSQLKYMCKNKQISLEAGKKINGLGKILHFQTTKKTLQSVYTDTDHNHMFKLFLCKIFSKLFQLNTKV